MHSVTVLTCLLAASLPLLRAREAWSGYIFGCSNTCEAKNCDNGGIRYGKYCGVFYTGCNGVEPCDPLDACCRAHDLCLSSWKITLSSGRDNCNEGLIRCLNSTEGKEALGFSDKCPLSQARETIQSRRMYANAQQPDGAGGTLNNLTFVEGQQQRSEGQDHPFGNVEMPNLAQLVVANISGADSDRTANGTA